MFRRLFPYVDGSRMIEGRLEGLMHDRIHVFSS